MLIPATHIVKEDNLQHISCDGCSFSEYYSTDVPMKDLLRASEAHYQTHLQQYYSDLRSRFRGTPDRYSFSRKKPPPELKPATSNPNRSNRTNFTKSLSYIDYTIP